MDRRGVYLVGGSAVLTLLVDRIFGIPINFAHAVHNALYMAWAVVMYIYFKGPIARQ